MAQHTSGADAVGLGGEGEGFPAAGRQWAIGGDLKI
jgi:hypothetical protein